MNAVFACLRWSTRAWRRRVFARKSTAAALVLGLPFIFLAYASFGSSIGSFLTIAFQQGSATFGEKITLCARFYAAFVLVLAGGTILGNFYVEGQRRTFQRLLSYPLKPRELYGVLLAFELFQAFAFLVPFVGLLIVRLATAGVPATNILCLAFYPFSTVACAIFGCRIATITVLSIVPRGMMSWRLPFLLVAFALPYVGRAAASFLRGGADASFLLTDWPGRAVVGFESGGWAWPVAFGVGLPVALGVADYVLFRRVLLRRYDAILGKMRRSGLSSLGTGWIAALVDRAPMAIGSIPFRATLKREALRITRDATLSLALLFPVATIGLIVVMVEFLLGYRIDAVLDASPIELTTLGLATLLFVGGIILPGISVPWEGDRLGPLRDAPFDARAILYHKATVLRIFTATCWLAAWALVLIVPLSRNALPPLLQWTIPLGLILAAWPVGRIGTAVGAIFPRVDAGSPILKMGLVGLGVHLSLSLVAVGSLTLAIVLPTTTSLPFIAMSMFIAAVWWIAQRSIVHEGERAIRATRTEE